MDMLIKSLQQRGNTFGTRLIDVLGQSKTPSPEPNLRRGSMLQAESGRRTEHRVARETIARSRRTRSERKYGRAPPTAMEREVQGFLEDLLKT